MQPLLILFGAAFTCAVCLGLGGLLLHDACRDWGVRFVSGAAVLSLVVCALCGAGLVYPLVFLGIGLVVVGVAIKVGRTPGSARDALVPPSGHPWCEQVGGGAGRGPAQRAPRPSHRVMGILWLIAFGMYAVLYLSNAMAPEISPDGAAYHLGLVGHYLREHASAFDIAHVHGCHHLPGTIAAARLLHASVPYVLAPNGTAPRIEQRRFAKLVFDVTAGRNLVRKAARVLAVHTVTVRRLAEAGRVPFVRDSSGKRLFKSEDIEELARERKQQGKTRQW